MKRFFKAIAILLLWVPILMIMVGTMTSCTPEKESNKTEDPIYYIVTFKSNGGSSVRSQAVEKGGTVTKPKDPTREGYTFDGWYTEKEGGDEFDFATTKITSPIIIYAHWSKAENVPVATLVYDNGSANGSITAVKVGNKYYFDEPETPKKDYNKFLGWFVDDTQFNFSTPVTKNITLTAKWDKITDYIDYYISMNGHLDHTFKVTLHTLLKKTHKTQLSYTPGVWDALKKIDEDPNNQENILCIYTGRSIPKANQDKGSSGINIWNREHMWPNSHGFSSKDYAAYTDIHHLFASEKNINATRGNKDFNYVENGNSDSYGNKWNSTFFEPRDEVKGDIARAMFYMVVRYADPNELVLSLVNQTTSSSSNKTGQLGYLNVLLQWHKMDPVSEKEKQRNEIIYSLQGNRNPFIDYPDWVNLLYPNQ